MLLILRLFGKWFASYIKIRVVDCFIALYESYFFYKFQISKFIKEIKSVYLVCKKWKSLMKVYNLKPNFQINEFISYL